MRPYRLPSVSKLHVSSSLRSSQNEFPTVHPQFRSLATGRASPKVAESSIWTSLIPKFLRNRDSRALGNNAPKSKEWNPASYFIVIFVLIGSQAIRMIVLRNDFANYTRSTEAKIELLREVIERLQKGEQVDVKKLLGTGDEAKEREWEEGKISSQRSVRADEY